MNKLCLSLLFSFGILFSNQASALGLSSSDIKKLCKKVYDDLNLDLLRKGQLEAEAFNDLDPSSTIVFAIGKKGTIFVKVTKSGKVYKLNADNVFELVNLDSFEEIVYANFHRTLTFTQLSQGNILGLEWVDGTSETFWILPTESSADEQSAEGDSQSEGVNSDDLTIDSSDIYEANLSQDSSVDDENLTIDTPLVRPETGTSEVTDESSEQIEIEVLPYSSPSVNFFANEQYFENQEYFTASELLTDTFTGWADEKLPLFGTYITSEGFDSNPGSPAKKKRKVTSLSCGSELNLFCGPKGDDNDGDEDYGRFLNFGM